MDLMRLSSLCKSAGETCANRDELVKVLYERTKYSLLRACYSASYEQSTCDHLTRLSHWHTAKQAAQHAARHAATLHSDTEGPSTIPSGSATDLGPLSKAKSRHGTAFIKTYAIVLRKPRNVERVSLPSCCIYASHFAYTARVQQCTSQHSTAQHSTAQRSAAQRRWACTLQK